MNDSEVEARLEVLRTETPFTVGHEDAFWRLHAAGLADVAEHTMRSGAFDSYGRYDVRGFLIFLPKLDAWWCVLCREGRHKPGTWEYHAPGVPREKTERFIPDYQEWEAWGRSHEHDDVEESPLWRWCPSCGEGGVYVSKCGACRAPMPRPDYLPDDPPSTDECGCRSCQARP